MPRHLIFMLALSSALVPALSFAAGAASAGSPYTLDHALTSRRLTAPTWSADGQKLAFVVDAPDTAEDSNNQDLWLWEARTGSSRRLTYFAKNDYSPTFSPGGDTLAFVSARGTGEDAKPQIQFLPLRGGEPWTVAPQNEAVGEIQWSPDGRSIVFTLLDTIPKQIRDWKKKKWDHVIEDEELQHNHLWILDVATGKARRLTSGNFNVAAPRWSPDSRTIAANVSPTNRVDDGNLADLAVIDAASGTVRKLDVKAEGDAAVWSPDGRWLAFTAGHDRKAFVERSDLWIVPAAGGQPVAVTREFDETPKLPCWNATSDTLFFHAWIGASTVVASVARTGGHVTLGIDRHADASTMVRAAHGEVAWTQSDPTHASELWMAAAPGASGRAASDVNAGIAALSLASTRSVTWKSSDGQRIEGVLVRPAGAARAGVLPTLVYLHGGPYNARFGLEFNSMAQLMAARGFQVFMPNFRSSGGYGVAFMIRKRADWGGQDWRDVTTGLDSLVNAGLADGGRLGVFGHSYGGYLSAWAITQTNRFKAAIVSAGAVDLAALWAQSDTHQYRAFEFGGEPWKSFELWRRSSPIAQYAKVKTPTLVLNGEADQRIPYPQAQQDYQSLKFLGVPTQFVHYPREPHGLREPRHRADWLTRQMDWFDRWVK